MNQPVTWVVGAGGLLGRHVAERLTATGHELITQNIPWSDPDEAVATLQQGFSDLLARVDDGRWNIAWCAGAGVVSTSAEALDQDAKVFGEFVRHLGKSPIACARGAFFLASSAGGVYAGSPDTPPFTEDTEPLPLAPYGFMKLAKETELTAVAEATGMRVFIGRISNLYGPGQNIEKPQGLVSHLCRAHFTGQPLPIYVPLDTLRDYLLVSDCAAMVVAGLDDVRRVTSAEEPVALKILASGRGTSIAALIAESTRIFRRKPQIELVSSPAAAGQVLDLRMRSVRWPELDRFARTTLPAGIAITADDIERRLRLAAQR